MSENSLPHSKVEFMHDIRDKEFIEVKVFSVYSFKNFCESILLWEDVYIQVELQVIMIILTLAGTNDSSSRRYPTEPLPIDFPDSKINFLARSIFFRNSLLFRRAEVLRLIISRTIPIWWQFFFNTRHLGQRRFAI